MFDLYNVLYTYTVYTQHIYSHTDRDYKKLANMIMEAKKSQDLQSAS